MKKLFAALLCTLVLSVASVAAPAPKAKAPEVKEEKGPGIPPIAPGAPLGVIIDCGSLTGLGQVGIVLDGGQGDTMYIINIRCTGKQQTI